VAARSEARALIARTLDRGFESRSRYGCLSSNFSGVFSCVGIVLATSLPLVQGVLPYVDIRLGNRKIRVGEGPILDYKKPMKEEEFNGYS
jgi:hypothetical protein